jgi:ribosomal protein L28
MTPSKEKGAKLLRFFIQHNGAKMVKVNVHKTAVRLLVKDKSSAVKLSAKTMEYARQARKVLAVALIAGIQDELADTVLLQA